MKILFLDIDGVVNCATTKQRHRGFIGIQPDKATIIRRIINETKCEVVLSSTWRKDINSMAEVKRRVCHFIDRTPNSSSGIRGNEIKFWLDQHPEVTKYAILDDDSDMLEEQLPNFFKTTWKGGITEEIADAVIKHLNA